jgi:hypothetical protein
MSTGGELAGVDSNSSLKTLLARKLGKRYADRKGTLNVIEPSGASVPRAAVQCLGVN